MNTAPVQEDDILDAMPPRPQAVERFRAQELTTSYRLQLLVGRLADQAVTAGAMALLLLPILLLGILTVDLPARMFDGWAAAEVLRPSQWLSRGDLVMALGLFFVVLVTRRHGGATASQALGLAWIAAICISIVMLLYLAPQLEAGDLPNGRFTIGFVASWYAGGLGAITVYDLTRGSRWWRPPLLALAFGFGLQSSVYFVVVYAGTGTPWLWWLAAKFVIQVAMVLGFVLIYRMVRGRFHPKSGRVSGFGGR